MSEKLTLRKTAPNSEFSEVFIQGMIDRMGVSFYKYGKVDEAYPLYIDALASMRDRVKKYKETRNSEYLIDAANFLMIEFMCPSLEDVDYKPTDVDGSIGRVEAWNHTQTQDSNKDLKEAWKNG